MKDHHDNAGAGADTAEPDSALPAPVPLNAPAEGVPPVIADSLAIADAAQLIKSGTGPVAVDTERASGYRYSQRAYLIQLRREGAGSFLIDPVGLEDSLGPLIDALSGVEWVLHAASQDLPCLTELNMRPDALFDTELAGRLAGFERVSLGALTERLLGYTLEKGHGAADWSARPLPEDWLNYAALDVELLVPLRDVLDEELSRQGKRDWAAQEFEAVRTAPPAAPRTDPWRRTSGIHKLRKPRQRAAVRAMWEAREAIAAERDISPGRILPDSAIVNAATVDPTTEQELIALPVFRGRAQRRLAKTWSGALREARELPQEDLPTSALASDGPPPANRWADKDPDAAARLAAARTAVTAIAEQHDLPVENLLQPDLLRRTCWQPPADIGEAGVAEALRSGGARAWQIELTVGALSTALGVRAG